MGGFCQHGRIWTTCPTCGKDVIRASKGRRKTEDDAWGPAVVPARPRTPPPEEPEETPYESPG